MTSINTNQETAVFHDHMDAQQIVLDTDPEATSADIHEYEQERSNKKFCCCRLLLWYISPISCGIGHSILCIIYHALNFGVALALFIFDITCISTSVGFMGLCCFGIPLLWLTFECILILSRIDLAITYGLVEQSSKVNPARKHLLSLSLYFKDFPLCCCWNRDGSSTMDIMVSRMKYLFTSWDLLSYITYHVFVKPIGWITWIIIIIVGANIGLIGLPIWYSIDDTLFKQNQITMGYSSDCLYSKDNFGVICPKNYWWIINSFDRTMYVAIAALLILPLMVRFSNFLAELNKCLAYKFYTFYYTKDESTISDKTSLISHQKVRIDSV